MASELDDTVEMEDISSDDVVDDVDSFGESDNDDFFDAAEFMTSKGEVSPATGHARQAAGSTAWMASKRQRISGPRGEKRGIAKKAVDRTASDSDELEASFIVQQKPPRKRVKSGPSGSTAVSHKTGLPRTRQRSVEQGRRLRESRRNGHRPSTNDKFNFILSQLPPGLDGLASRQALLTASALRVDGNTAHRGGDYVLAIQRYTEAIQNYSAAIVGNVAIPPPVQLWTNRAASYMSVGQYEVALEDMKLALQEQAEDLTSYVRRLGRMLRCYLGLLDFESTEVQQTVAETKRHAELLLESSKDDSARKTAQDAQSTVTALETGASAVRAVQSARSRGDWQMVADGLSRLLSRAEGSKREAPRAWRMMQIEAFAMLGRWKEVGDMMRFDHGEEGKTAEILWLRALLAYSAGRIADSITVLDDLRRQVELPEQASRLLHRAYRIQGILQASANCTKTFRWQQALVNLDEILRMLNADSGLNAVLRCDVLLRRASVRLRASGGSEKMLLSTVDDIDAVLGDQHATASQLFTAHTLKARVFHSLLRLDDAVSAARAAEAFYNDATPAEVVAARAELKQWEAQKDLHDRTHREQTRPRRFPTSAGARPEPAMKADDAKENRRPHFKAEPFAREGPKQSKPGSHSGRQGGPSRAQAAFTRTRRPATPYEVLNVPENATFRQIRKAYLDLSRLHHPDKGGDGEVFKRVSSSFETLENLHRAGRVP